MSVINQMLKDLDQRQGTGHITSKISESVPLYVVTAKTRHTKIIIMIMILITLILVMIWRTEYWTVDEETTNRVTVDPIVIDEAMSQPSSVVAEQRLVEVAPEMAIAIENTEEQQQVVHESSLDKSAQKIFNPFDPEKEKLPATTTGLVATSGIHADKTQRVIKSKPQLDQKTQALKLFKSAQGEIKAGRSATALQQLVRSLELNPDLHRARVLKLSLFMQQQQLVIVEEELATAVEQWPEVHQYRQLQAQLLLQQAQPEKALEVLQLGIPAIVGATDFHALLAYVAQQATEHPIAVKHYRMLVQQHSGRADWWLGLAISEDSLGNVAAALKAYQNSISRSGLEISVLQYARQRIKVLQGF